MCPGRMYRQLLWRLLLVYIALSILFFLLIVVAYAVPRTWTCENTKKSVETVLQEGNYPRIMNNPIWQLDNFTDATMLNMSVVQMEGGVIKNAMLNPRSYFDNDSLEVSPASSTLQILYGNTDNCRYWQYGRYWHGYMAPLKVLLIFTSIGGIRIINLVFLWLLFGITTILIYRKMGVNKALAYGMGLLLCGFFVVPLSMQYCACYYIAFIAVLLMLIQDNASKSIPYIMFIAGVCTSYFDFLTVPIITLTLPLLVIIWRHDSNSIVANTREGWKIVLLCCFIWGVGYSLFWISKWIIAGILTNENILQNAIQSVQQHTSISNSTDTDSHLLKVLVLFSGLIVVTLTDLITFFKYYSSKVSRPYYLLFISLLPVMWFLLCSYHSSAHWWFTYRSLSATVIVTLYSLISSFHKNDRVQHKKDCSTYPLL